MATAALTEYAYRVRDREGTIRKGTVEAESEAAVYTRLRSMGTVVLQVKPATSAWNRDFKIMPSRVKLRDVALFSRQLSAMSGSGLNILRGLNILADQSENEAMRRTLRQVRQDVESGDGLSAAMAKHPKVFPPLMVHMTRAAEGGGSLASTMGQIADSTEAEARLRSKIKSASVYPGVILILTVLMLIGMLLFVVPMFTKMFADLDAQLPAATQFLVTISSQAKTLVPLFGLAVFGGVVAWKKFNQETRVRHAVDGLKLRLPIFGTLFKKVALARFARNLSSLRRSGVPILQALDYVADASGNVIIGDALRDVREQVREGSDLSAALAEHSVFPGMVTQMLAFGDETGETDQMLDKIAEFYDQEVERASETMTSLIEPLLVVFLGGMIGGMVFALYAPMLSIYDQIG